ncbi:MAG: leucine-rich repeat protein [Clostridia bacterium]|jgi:uncharacterized repeat protein (TIGR02543 family)
MRLVKIITALLLLSIILTGMTACVDNRYSINAVCDEQQGTTKGSGKYKPGESVEITAVAKEGYVFDRWSDNDTSAKKTIIVEKDITYTALFKRLYVISVICDETKGTVTGGGMFTEGTQIQISVTPKNENSLYQWNDGVDELSRTVTVTEDFTYIAEFVDITDFIFEKETGTVKGYLKDVSKVIIPKYIYDIKVNEIADWAFYNKQSLSIIRIPDSVTRIGARALSVTSLITIDIPNSVVKLGDSAFSDNPNLVSINIPSSVTEMGVYMFYGNSSMTTAILPTMITELGRETFSKCSSLTDINIPSAVKKIGDYVFYECSSLSMVTLPEGLESIGYGAFSYCTSLTSITIPSSVNEIRPDSFAGTELQTIYVTKGSYADTWCIKNNFSNRVVYLEP